MKHFDIRKIQLEYPKGATVNPAIYYKGIEKVGTN
jgi:hypothetical protein